MPEKVLLVDDDLDTLRLVGLMLQRQGYEILQASNGLQALELAVNESPDLILLDVMMPDMDGYEVARRLRANPATTHLPIIMFTAKAQVDDKVMGFEAGADGYLTKPTQPRELFAQMKAILARSSKSRAAIPAVPVPPPPKRGFTVGVIAARGGLGVSTLALNLGVALHDSTRQSVLVAEFRPGQGTIGYDLGLSRHEGLNRLLQMKPDEISAREVEASLRSMSSGMRLLLASHQPRDCRYIQKSEVFEALIRQIALMSRYVIVDLGASINPAAEKALLECDELIVLVDPTPHMVAHTRELIDDLISMGISDGCITTVLVNRHRSGLQLSWSQVQEQLGRQISVVFTPAPELAYQAATNNMPMIKQQPESMTAQQFSKLAERLVQRSQ